MLNNIINFIARRGHVEPRVRLDDPGSDAVWQKGRIEPGGYRFEAKAYGLPSEFGIEGGCISKLTVTDRWSRNEIMLYDRGWIVEPHTDAHKAILKLILDAFPPLENPPTE